MRRAAIACLFAAALAVGARGAQAAHEVAITYVGGGGITWLHRWALTKRLPKTFFAGEPETPAWVAELARP